MTTKRQSAIAVVVCPQLTCRVSSDQSNLGAILPRFSIYPEIRRLTTLCGPLATANGTIASDRRAACFTVSVWATPEVRPRIFTRWEWSVPILSVRRRMGSGTTTVGARHRSHLIAIEASRQAPRQWPLHRWPAGRDCLDAAEYAPHRIRS